MRSAEEFHRAVLIALLAIVLVAFMLFPLYHFLGTDGREALKLSFSVLGALSAFMLVIAVVYEGERVIKVVKKDDAFANPCACSKDRKG